MSARKFKHPRHGHLGFRPKRRSKTVRPRVKAFPSDDASKEVHLSAFMGYKAGMTHVIRTKEVRHKNKIQLKEIMEAVTAIEVPPMKIIGAVGYKQTMKGLERSNIILADNIDEGAVRKMFDTPFRPGMTYTDKRKNIGFTAEDVEALKKGSESIRAIVQTQPSKIKCLKQKKSHIAEFQVNGGSIVEKIDWILSKFDTEIRVGEHFNVHEMIDTIGVTKGHGFTGVIKRWGVRKLPHKTRRGNRKVACIGAWHPSRVMFSVARAGQHGYHRRTEVNKEIYHICKEGEKIVTEYDFTEKEPTPMGGFVNYGEVKNDLIYIKGGCTGPKKRVLTIRKSLMGTKPSEEFKIKFFNTGAQNGSARFQTSDEKRRFYGISKSEVI